MLRSAMLLIVSFVVLVLAGCPPSGVLVPNVTNLTQLAAEAAIVAADLAVGEVTTAFSATVPVGSVVSQAPAGGARTNAGAAVNLVVSAGPAPASSWAFTSSMAYTRALAVKETADGGCILAGYKGGSAMYAVKLNAAGSVEWEAEYPEWHSEARGVVQTADGGYMLVGTATNEAVNETKMLLVKLDAAGEIEWHEWYGAPSPTAPEEFLLTRGYCINTTSDGGYVLAGEVYLDGQTDACIVKIDAAGNQEFLKRVGDPEKAEHVYAVQQTADGGFMLCGAYEPEDFESIVTMIKLDAAGDVEWQEVYQQNPAGNSRHQAYDFIQTLDGGYAIASRIHAFNVNTSWLLKLDADGNVLWDMVMDGDLLKDARAVRETPQGDLLFAGFTHVEHMALLKTTAGGILKWSYVYHRPQGGNSNAYAMDLTHDGGCILAGSVQTHAPYSMEAVKLKPVYLASP
jgi:hypothetical protein